jgi:purine-nucleoside phosphorylase
MTASLSSFAQLTQVAQALRPCLALVLGSGAGNVARRLQRPMTVPFREAPGLAATTVAGHSGCLMLGDWLDRRVLIFEGRLHYYEGHSWRDVTTPIHIASFLGAPAILFTNAAGGIRDTLSPGGLMAICDHFEWNRPYAWRHPGVGGVGSDRRSPYSTALLNKLDAAALRLGVDLFHGVYAAVTGPCYETPAEIRALKTCGADAVGMSTTREVQAAHDLGMECAAVSCITNRAAGLTSAPINHDEVLTAASARSESLADLLEEVLRVL